MPTVGLAEGASAPQCELLGSQAFRAWTYSTGQQGAQSVSALRTALAFDPRLQVVAMCGLHDLVASHFASAMVLNQLPPVFACRAHALHPRCVPAADEGKALAQSAAAP